MRHACGEDLSKVWIEGLLLDYAEFGGKIGHFNERVKEMCNIWSVGLTVMQCWALKAFGEDVALI